MIKLILKITRNLLIGTLWTYVYLLISNVILIYFWNFSTLSAQSWKMIRLFWEGGGTIWAGKDYALLSLLLLLLPVWILGWRKLTKVNYLNILLTPIYIYNDRVIKKYGASSSRILLKNMGISKKVTEIIEQKMQSGNKIKTDEEVNKIRNAISEKINSVKNQ